MRLRARATCNVEGMAFVTGQWPDTRRKKNRPSRIRPALKSIRKSEYSKGARRSVSAATSVEPTDILRQQSIAFRSMIRLGTADGRLRPGCVKIAERKY